MLTIHLHHLKFHAFHGMYQQETIAGNGFEINVDIKIDVPEKITSINDTVNYVDLYNIINERMKKPTPLLETVIQDLGAGLKAFDEKILSVNITIIKTAPPIANFEGSVGISFSN